MFPRKCQILSTTPRNYSTISRRFSAVIPRITTTTKAPHFTVCSGDHRPARYLRALKLSAQILRLSTQSSLQSKGLPVTNVKMDVKAILSGKYPAKEHARRVVQYIKKKDPDATGVLYLEGQKTRMIEDNDESMPFRYLQIPPLSAPH